jgi:hypothetical protein
MNRPGLWLFIVVVFFLSCASVKERNVVDTGSGMIELTVAFNTEHYPWLLGTKYPQMAVWVSAGPDAQTVFATDGAAKDDWYFADKRPSALPVWSGIRNQAAGTDVDAVSGATPSGESHTISWQLPESFRGKEVAVTIEANVSFDYNAYYHNDTDRSDAGYSDVNGQPSVVWRASFTADDAVKEVEPVVIGHGHVLGSDPEIDADLSNITTADALFHYVRLTYHPFEK